MHQDRQYERSVQRTEFGNEELNTFLHNANKKYLKNHKEICVYNPHYIEMQQHRQYKRSVQRTEYRQYEIR
jgi:hypothetical protein